MKLRKTIVSLCMLWMAMAGHAKADGPLNEPISFSRVIIDDSFWRPRIKRLSEVTIPFCLDQCSEKTHRVENFAIAVPGHPEIELALIRLYHETSKKEYLDLAHFLLEERRPDCSWNEYACESCRLRP